MCAARTCGSTQCQSQQLQRARRQNIDQAPSASLAPLHRLLILVAWGKESAQKCAARSHSMLVSTTAAGAPVGHRWNIKRLTRSTTFHIPRHIPLLQVPSVIAIPKRKLHMNVMSAPAQPLNVGYNDCSGRAARAPSRVRQQLGAVHGAVRKRVGHAFCIVGFQQYASNWRHAAVENLLHQENGVGTTTFLENEEQSKSSSLSSIFDSTYASRASGHRVPAKCLPPAAHCG